MYDPFMKSQARLAEIYRNEENMVIPADIDYEQ